ncbi:MAG: hypothetical protein DMF53_03115 [Acidobacteria bacterium]|nr:MAG: hypothetical protein DMF53_03115 [Acidobacteriota bacterium]
MSRSLEFCMTQPVRMVEEPIPEPARIGPYRLARRLGQGGMGEVFLAWDERLGRRVALKRIRHEDPTARDRERFRREASAAARLSHPAVVQIYDVVEDATGDALVFEYVEGRTLRELLNEGLPSLDLATRLAREIAEGLAAAHASGLVHRDLKAENVMVTPDGHAKILDFGIAKATSPGGDAETLTAHGAVIGTFHVMSPEQARGGEVDARSDLFSLGVLLYELLTGRSPFRGRDSLDTLQRLALHQPPPVREVRPEISRPLSDLVDRLLAKLPEERPSTATAVVYALSDRTDALAEAPATGEELPTLAAAVPLRSRAAGRSGPGESYAPANPRRLKLLGVAVALLTVVALSIGFGARYLSRHPAARPVAPAPLRVAVLKPRVPEGAGEEFRLAASGALEAALSALASLDGIAPLEPAQSSSAASPVDAARTAAADEVLALALEPQGPAGARISLRRIQGRDGRVLWAGSLPVPVGGQRIPSGASTPARRPWR